MRRELPEDRDAIFAVHTAAFGVEGGTSVPEARLVDELRSDGAVIPALSLVAMLGGKLVGHVVCSRGSVHGRPLLGLWPLGVRYRATSAAASGTR